MSDTRVVITGVGLVTPSGTGAAEVWKNLIAGHGGIGPIKSFDASGMAIKTAGEIEGFDATEYVKPRKSLKVMARDAQLAMAAASLARADSQLAIGAVDPERFGVVFGAEIIRNPIEEVALPFRACMTDDEFHFELWGTNGLAACYPLAMLKLLPNMLGCHVSIVHDARGPNNTLCMAEAAGLSAIGEAMSVIRRGWADAMITGAACSRINCYDLLRLSIGDEVSHETDAARACRPFDVERDGQVRGEGAAALVMESRAAAEARRAPILAEVRGSGTAHGGFKAGRAMTSPGEAIRAAIRRALADAKMTAREIGFVSAHGLATRVGDVAEAEALHEVLPGVPVFGPKSYFGCLGAACGSAEAAVAVLALHHGEVPATRNCERPDPACPIDVIRDRPLTSFAPACVAVNYTRCGQAAAVVFGRP